MVARKEAKAYRTEKVQLGEYRTWMNHYLQDNLDIILNLAIPNNWDCLFVLFGREGCGKTTLGTQCAKYLAENFNLSTTVFTPDQFTKACENAKPESAILWDEAITGANSATHASKVSVNIISQLTQIRKKKLKIFLCFPYLDLLNKYFIKRCTGGVYIYAKGYDKRGYAKFYNHMELSMLYGFMKDRYKYYPDGATKVCNSSFYFKFSKCFCLDEKEYDEKKESSRKEFLLGEKKEIRDTKVNACDVTCHHPPSGIRYNKTDNFWTCRRCGKVWKTSPFNTANNSVIKDDTERGEIVSKSLRFSDVMKKKSLQ
jgi:hypothetical protein